MAGDILDADAVERAIDGCDAVFHLAAVYSLCARGRRRDADRQRRRDAHRARRGGPRAACRSCTRARARPAGRSRGRAATEDDAPPAYELAVPYKRTKLDGERLALRAAREGHRVVVVNPTTPVGPGDRRPTPTGKMVRDVAQGRARAYLARGVLNIVDVARRRGGPTAWRSSAASSGRRYLLGGENLTMREVFAHVARAAGRPAPRVPVPVAARLRSRAGRRRGAAPVRARAALLNLDEVRLARLPMPFDDSRARRELGHRSRPGAQALGQAADALPAEPAPSVS